MFDEATLVNVTGRFKLRVYKQNDTYNFSKWQYDRICYFFVSYSKVSHLHLKEEILKNKLFEFIPNITQ
jgi:hypothetical protein